MMYLAGMLPANRHLLLYSHQIGFLMSFTQVQPFAECQLQFKGKLQYSFCQVSA
jgi:hypothetical protein